MDFYHAKNMIYMFLKNIFGVDIINMELEKLGIKSILDNVKEYYIVGPFINYCLYGTEYHKIHIYTDRCYHNELISKLGDKLEIDWNYDYIKSIINYADRRFYINYFFDGKTIRKIN